MTLKEFFEQNGNKPIEIREDGTIKVLDEKGPWKPEKGDSYYTVDLLATSWDADRTDYCRLELGNVFQTREEAARMVCRLKARKKFLDAGGYEGPIKPNTKGWFVCLVKVRAAMPSLEYTLEPRHFNAITPTFVVWFESEEDCQKAINSLSDDEKAALCWTGESE